MLPPTAEQTDCVHRENRGIADADLLRYVRFIAALFLPSSRILDFSIRAYYSY